MNASWRSFAVIAFSAVVAVSGGVVTTHYVAEANATKAELDREIIGARASFGDLWYFKSQLDPESQRIAKQALTEIQAVFAPNPPDK